MNEPSNEAVQTTRGSNTIFIHSSLDDAGLTPQQFRVFAHISRRASDGDCWAGVDGMAKVCKMNSDTLRDALKVLFERNMVTKTERPGKTTVWRIPPPSFWKITPPERGVGCSNHPPETDIPHPPGTNGCHPPGTRGGEGNPIRKSNKGNPFPVVEVPEALQSPAFLKVWSEWLQHLKEKGRSKWPTESALKKQLSQCAAWGIPKSIATINRCIGANWQGLWAEKNFNSGAAGGSTIMPSRQMQSQPGGGSNGRF